MTTRSRLTCVGAFILASFVAAVATADTIDKRTTFSFNTPVAIPGVTLPAGSYLFHVVDTDTTRDVVQVLSADGKTPYAMFFTLPIWRSETSPDPELTFIETAADMPHAIRAWWHPGESLGYEFMYGREQARLLAKGSGTPVLSVATPPPVWTEPEWIPPTEVEDHEIASPGPIAVAEAPAVEPVFEPEAPYEALPTTDSPVTILVLTAIVLIGSAAATQLIVRRKRT